MLAVLNLSWERFSLCYIFTIIVAKLEHIIQNGDNFFTGNFALRVEIGIMHLETKQSTAKLGKVEYAFFFISFSCRLFNFQFLFMLNPCVPHLRNLEFRKERVGIVCAKNAFSDSYEARTILRCNF